MDQLHHEKVCMCVCGVGWGTNDQHGLRLINVLYFLLGVQSIDQSFTYLGPPGKTTSVFGRECHTFG